MLFRKMLRELKIYKVQFSSIFIMSFLALAIYSGLGSESKGYEEELTSYYEETNFADIWLHGANFTKEDEENLLGIEEVKNVERRLVLEGIGALENKPDLDLYVVDQGNICKLYIKDGKAFDSESENGIWLDYEFATRNKLSVGDAFSFETMNMKFSYEIEGLVYSPEYVYKESDQMIPNHKQNGYCYVARQSLPENIPTIYNQMLLTLNTNLNGNDIDNKVLEEKCYEKIQANKETGSSGISVFIDRTKMTSHAVFSNEIAERKAMTTVFPIAFLLIVLLTIMTTMSRLVGNQRIQIGTLKALGMKKYKVMLHYVSYSFFLTGIGGMLGLIAGPLILPPLFHEPMRACFTLPDWHASLAYSSLLVLGLTVLLASYITYVSCRKVLVQTPTATLRPETKKIDKISRFEKTQFWEKRSFMYQWNVRDIFTNKLRSVMAIIGVAGTMGLLLMGFGARDAFQSVIDIKFNEICQYETKYCLEENVTAEQIEAIGQEKQKEGIVVESAMETVITIQSDDCKEMCDLQVFDGVNSYQLLDEEWQEFEMSDSGIYLSKKMAEKLNVAVGDQVKWKRLGDETWRESTVTALFRDPAWQGCIMEKGEFEDRGEVFLPTTLFAYGNGSKKQLAEKSITNMAGVSRIESVEESMDSTKEMLKTMNLLITVVCIVAGILEIVVLYNLGVLSYTEKERELATLKVLGFQSSRIRKILFMQNIWLTLIGLIPGYFFGKLILEIVMSNMGSEFDLQIGFSKVSIILCVLFTCILSLCVNGFLSRKVNSIDMVSALKNVE